MKYVVGTDSVVNDVIKLGTPGSTQVPYAYTTDVNVYYITVDGKLVPSDITAIAEDDDDVVFLKTNNKGRLTDVYVRIVDAPDTIGPSTPAAKVASIGAQDRSSGTMALNVTLDAATGTSAVKAKLGLYVLNGGTWAYLRDVEVTVPASTASGSWGTEVLVSGLLAGQYKVVSSDLANPTFVTMR